MTTYPRHRPRVLVAGVVALGALLALTVAAGCGADQPATTATATSTATTVGPAATSPAATSPVDPAGAGGTDPATTVTVAVFQFQPVPLTVPVGTTVTFANRDETTHEPMSGAPGAVTTDFDVRLEGRGATGTVTLTRPGTYPYFCAIHDSMTGELVVTG